MWQFAEPVYAWALLSLGVPVFIHLHSRYRSQVKVLGSLRWLKEVEQARSGFRQLQQLPLLLIRLALLLTVIALLAGLYQNEKNKPRKNLKTLILIHPEAGDSLQFRQLASRWQNDSVQVRWLVSGFPIVSQPSASLGSPEVWSLVAEAEQRFPADSLHLIAPNRADYFADSPPRLATPLSWELTDLKKDTLRLVQAYKDAKTPRLLWFQSGTTHTGYLWQRGLKTLLSGFPEITEQQDSLLVKSATAAYAVPLTAPDTLVIAGTEIGNFRSEWQTFRAAVQALAAFHGVRVRFTTLPEKADWMVNFGTETAFRETEAPNTGLQWQYRPLVHSAGWIEPVGTKSLLIRKELSPAQALEGGLLQALRPYLLAQLYDKTPEIKTDYRKIQLTARISGKRQSETPKPGGKPPEENRDFWLGILALLLLALERIWYKQVR